MKFLYSIILLLPNLTLFSVTSYSQAPSIQWQKSMGGTAYDNALSVILTFDGGSITAGVTTSFNGDVTFNHGSGDVWIVKQDNAGNVQWQKSYGSSWDEGAFAIIQTADSGYAIAATSSGAGGNVTLNHGLVDCWILKIDALGNLEWQKSFGGSSIDIAYDIHQTSDLGFIIAGYTQSNDGDVTSLQGYEDYWIIKLNSNGTLEWQKTFGGTQDERAYEVHQTTDGGYIAGGYSKSNDGDVSGNHGDYDFWVIKLDGNGTLQWQKTFGGSSNDQNKTIQQTADGGYITAGFTASVDGDVTANHGSQDLWLVKLNSSGALVWQKTLGGTGGEEALHVQQLSTGNFHFIGTSYSTDGDVTGNHGGTDGWCGETDNVGNLIWQRSLGGSDYDEMHAIAAVSDSNFIVAGFSLSGDGDLTLNHGDFDYWVVKFGISTAVPGYSIDSVAPVTIVLCGSQAAVSIPLPTTSINGFVSLINLTASNYAPGLIVSFSANPLTPGNTTIVTISNIDILGTGIYSVDITGVAGTITQTRTLTFTILPGPPPVILTQPVSSIVCVGGNATFDVVASSTGIYYQWQVSTTGCAGTFADIPSANAATFSIPAVSVGLNGYAYRLIIRSNCSLIDVVSDCVDLTVNVPPTITSVADTTEVCSGNPVILTANGAGISGFYSWMPGNLNGNLVTVNPTATVAPNPISYTVIGTDGNGCTGTASLVVTANPLPVVTLSATPALTALLPGQTSILTASAIPTGNYNYFWRRNGSAIPASTGNTLTVTANDTGRYTVTVTSLPASCMGTSNEIKISDSVINHINIYPNPNDGQFIISYPVNLSVSMIVVVFDSKGARVFEQKQSTVQSNGHINIDLRPAPSGVYMLALYDNSGKLVVTSKIIVRH